MKGKPARTLREQEAGATRARAVRGLLREALALGRFKLLMRKNAGKLSFAAYGK